MDDEVDMLEDEDGSVIVVDDVDLVVDEIEEVEGPVRDRCVCMCVCVCGWSRGDHMPAEVRVQGPIRRQAFAVLALCIEAGRRARSPSGR